MTKRVSFSDTVSCINYNAYDYKNYKSEIESTENFYQVVSPAQLPPQPYLTFVPTTLSSRFPNLQAEYQRTHTHTPSPPIYYAPSITRPYYPPTYYQQPASIESGHHLHYSPQTNKFTFFDQFGSKLQMTKLDFLKSLREQEHKFFPNGSYFLKFENNRVDKINFIPMRIFPSANNGLGSIYNSNRRVCYQSGTWPNMNIKTIDLNNLNEEIRKEEAAEMLKKYPIRIADHRTQTLPSSYTPNAQTNLQYMSLLNKFVITDQNGNEIFIEKNQFNKILEMEQGRFADSTFNFVKFESISYGENKLAIKVLPERSESLTPSVHNGERRFHYEHHDNLTSSKKYLSFPNRGSNIQTHPDSHVEVRNYTLSEPRYRVSRLPSQKSPNGANRMLV